jgi:hypothetical protein
MLNVKFTVIICLLLLIGLSVDTLAQEQDPKDDTSFEELYDDPYNINKLFIGFIPFYGELSATNVNAGYGIEAQYYHKTIFDVKFQTRKTYSSKFYDFNRELAAKNSSVSNKTEVYNYFELGGTYHIKDFDSYSSSKFFVRKKEYSRNRWAATVPTLVEVPGKVRQIYGARVGSVIWNSTIDINRTLEKQNLSNADLINSEGNSLPDTYMDDQGMVHNMNVFSNLYATNIYLGGSYTRIRNIAVDFDNYDSSVDDGIVTFFFDVIYAPALRIDPIIYNDVEYSTDAIKLNKIGMRAGLDGKFNRKLSWAYGGEIGYRPSINGRGFFAMMKISIPMYSTNLVKKIKDTEE